MSKMGISMPKMGIRADHIGAVASLLCIIHCMATPLLFLVKTCAHTCCVDAPVWWQLIDYVFLVISGLAIYYATKNSTKRWVQIALWSAWVVLLLTFVNEQWKIVALPERFSYLPALIIVVLHFYNRRCCKVCDHTPAGSQ